MSPTVNLRKITNVVSDGTGLTPEEVWLVGGVTAIVAVVSGLLSAFDAVMRLMYELGER
jgi:hypothetical protein